MLLQWQPPRGFGAAMAAVFILASGYYGAVRGDHLGELHTQWQDLCDSGANAFGFRIAQVTLSGQKQIGHNEIFAAAGLSSHSSLPFFDVAEAREKLLAVPWIAGATLKKFYPGRLEIDVKERVPFALWQHDGRVFVIADDGTRLQPYDDARFSALPLVVGLGAETRAREFLTLLAAHPDVGQNVRAAIFVAQRRWNLRLKNGVDVRLPETGADAALQTLAKLDRDQGLMTRDIVAVDLRLPDRVSVQLSDTAAQARAETLKDSAKSVKDAAKDEKSKKPKAKGSDA